MPDDIASQIARAEQALADLGARERRLWDLMAIPPTPWGQSQYPDAGPFWVVAIMGRRCLYYNFVEGGWGWGRFEAFGTVSQYHWQQDEIQHVVHFTLLAIEHGGTC